MRDHDDVPVLGVDVVEQQGPDDGGDEGVRALYERSGLSRQWFFGRDLEFKLRLMVDGTGLYYDFSGAEEGESRSPDSVFRCEKVT